MSIGECIQKLVWMNIWKTLEVVFFNVIYELYRSFGYLCFLRDFLLSFIVVVGYIVTSIAWKSWLKLSGCEQFSDGSNSFSFIKYCPYLDNEDNWC